MVFIYTIADLKHIDFFKSIDISHLLDSLTGVVSRQYILDFANYLIQNKTPFAMCMIDLDNFKTINDTYGHKVGDVCLKDVGDSLIKFVADSGVVGRFGGDEFIIIYLKHSDYDSMHDFLIKLFDSKIILRRNFEYENIKTFITGTIGSASYPLDASSYDELFLKMDKALYRGKIKGRNCFIIYVEAKHKDIVVKERGTDSLLNKFKKISQLMKTKNQFKLITDLVDYLYRTLHPYNIIFANSDNYIWSGNDTKYYFYEEDTITETFNKLLKNEEMLATSSPNEDSKDNEEAIEFIKSRNVHAYVIIKVGNLGHIALYENGITRIWQDSDLSLLYFAANELNHKLTN